MTMPEPVRVLADEPVPDAAQPPVSRAAWLGQTLKERVLSGRYAPGERIREADLRREFQLSNGPIREGLQALVAEGLAQKAPWQGVTVIDLSEREIVELFQVRLALLEYTAELAALRAPPEILAQAADVKANIDLAYGDARAGSAHPSFSRSLSRWLLAASGNQMMARAWDRTVTLTHLYVNALLTGTDGHRSAALIHRLVDAIVARDVAGARAAVRALTVQTLTDLHIDGALP